MSTNNAVVMTAAPAAAKKTVRIPGANPEEGMVGQLVAEIRDLMFRLGFTHKTRPTVESNLYDVQKRVWLGRVSPQEGVFELEAIATPIRAMASACERAQESRLRRFEGRTSPEAVKVEETLTALLVKRGNGTYKAPALVGAEGPGRLRRAPRKGRKHNAEDRDEGMPKSAPRSSKEQRRQLAEAA